MIDFISFLLTYSPIEGQYYGSWVQFIPLIAAGISAMAASKGSEKGGTVDTTSSTNIPDWALPYAQGMMGPASQTFNQTQGYGAGLQGMSQSEMEKTVQGNYLDPRTNPYLQETFEQAANRVRQNISPQFGHMQAFGQNSGYNQALGRSLKELATNLYGTNYGQERDRQFNATLSTPGFNTAQVGSAFAPFNQYANLLKGWGSNTFGTQPFYENKSGNMLGGALAGMQLGRMFGGGGGGGGMDWANSGSFGGGGNFA